MGMIIPEVRLCNIIDRLLAYIDHDVTNNREDKTLLYKYFNGVTSYKKDYYAEAKNLFIRDDDHPRKIKTRLAFDASRAGMPTIHITIPSEQLGANSIGIGEDGANTDYVDGDSDFSVNYLRRFESQYQIVCTSDNHAEVMLMTNLIKGGLISIFDELSFEGFENVKISTQELKANPDLVPKHIFMRAVGISFHYDLEVPRWDPEKIFTDITAKGNPHE